MPTENPTYLDRAVADVHTVLLKYVEDPNELACGCDLTFNPSGVDPQGAAREATEAAESAIREDERQKVEAALKELADEFERHVLAAREDGIAERRTHGSNKESWGRECANAWGRQAVLDTVTALNASPINDEVHNEQDSSPLLKASPETEEGDSGQGEDDWPEVWLGRPGPQAPLWFTTDRDEANREIERGQELQRYQPAPGGEDR